MHIDTHRLQSGMYEEQWEEDTDDLIDHEQGIPHFRGYPGRIVACDPPEGMSATTLGG